jgi:hypothetical protein
VRDSSLRPSVQFRPTDVRPAPVLSDQKSLKRNRACLNVGGFPRATVRTLNRGTATASKGVPESRCSRDEGYQKKVPVERLLIVFHTVAMRFLPTPEGGGILAKNC